MKKLLANLIALSMLLSVGAAYASQDNVYMTIYVSQSGNDSWDGSAQKPFATIERARDEVRKYNADMTGDIVVNIDSGMYKQTKTLVFDDRDSGYNGYDVIYRGNKENFPIISGGKRINNWEHYENGIWRAKAENYDAIREMYVDGRKALLARTEEKVNGIDFYHTKEEPNINRGVIMSADILGNLTNHDEIVFRYYATWMCYFLKCDGIIKLEDGNYAALLQQDEFHTLTTRNYNSPSYKTSVYIENAYELLNMPGEFYYNTHEDYLYYMPLSGQNMENAEVIVPNLESLVEVEGRDLNNKIHNVTFENLKFSHATWNYPALNGYNSVQAQWIYSGGWETLFTPANVSVSAAEEISFLNNDFTMLGAVGLGFHEGVNNSRVIGNAFYDIKDSGMSLGLVTHDYIEDTGEYYNSAYEAKATASSERRGQQAYKANDDNPESRWAKQNTDAEQWIMFEYDEPTRIDKAVFYGVTYAGNGTVDEVWLSNEESFEDKVVMEKESTNDVYRHFSYSVGKHPHKETVFVNSSEEKYRFVKVFVNGGVWINDTKFYDHSRPAVPTEEVCKNNVIKNNYFTRVGDYYWSSPGFAAYYTEGTLVDHNYFNFLAYTAICSGWGWDYALDSTTSKNNTITNNYGKDLTKECFDGGGVYVLGRQPNTLIEGNYFYQQHQPSATMYMDTGSDGYTWKRNVLEDVGRTAIGSVGLGDGGVKNTLEDTYTSVYAIETTGDMAAVTDTHTYVKYMPPAEARAIMENAGLEEEYEHIVNRVPVYDDYVQFGQEGYKNVVEHGFWPAFYAKTNFLEFETRAVEFAINNVKTGKGLWEYSEEAVEKLRSALYRAKGVLADSSIANDDPIWYAEYQILRKAYEEFVDSRNKLTYDELKLLIEQTLDNAKIGDKIGCYPQYAADDMRKALKGGRILKTIDAYMDLEQSFMMFLGRKITNSIKNVGVNDASAIVKIDESASSVTVFTSTSLNELKLTYELSDNCHLSNETAAITDYSRPISLVVYNEAETQYRYWTVNVRGLGELKNE